jgi:hypothetical protein
MLTLKFWLRAGAAIMLCLALGTAGAARATSSSAFGIEASFTAKHVKTGLDPVGAASGAAPPAYSKTVTIGAFQQVIPLLAAATPVPTLYVDTGSIRTQVASSGIGIDSESAASNAAVKGLNITLALPPPHPNKVPIDLPFLAVTAGRIDVAANLSQVFPRLAETSSSASISGLTITGSLVNNQTITFSGAVPNNTVLFQSDTVTITVNGKFTAGVISCTPKCSFWPVTVSGNAIEIVLTNANLNGNIVSGDIVVAGAQAGSGGLMLKTAQFQTAK